MGRCTLSTRRIEGCCLQRREKWAEQIMKTTGEAARIKMSPEKSVLKNDGYDLIYVRVDIQDKNGLTVPRSKNL